MAIPSQTIEQIAAANDIVEVIGAYFPLRRAGTNFKALCPFHQEKTPSFHVNPQRQTFHCFGCGVGGSVFRFVMDYEHVDFPAAVRKLGARVGIPVVEERGGVDEDRQHEARRIALQLHAEAAEWFQENLLKRDIGKPARDYLKQRGIDRPVAKNWQIGYAPDEWDAFLKWAQQRGYQRRQLLQSGLVKLRDEEKPESDVYDRFRGRVMFPICNDVGEVIAFSGRLLGKDDQAAKYINSPETPLFRKGSVLFGLHKSKRALIEASSAIVCEGQLDLITLFEAGISNVVAPQGTAFTESQARALKRYVSEVILCFDADSAGTKAAERSLDALLQNGLIVRVVEMPSGLDPDLLVRRDGKEEFEKRVTSARDFFHYWIDREVAMTDLSSLGARTKLARKLASTVSHVSDLVMRERITNMMAHRLELPTSEFTTLLTPTSIKPSGVISSIDVPAYQSRHVDFLSFLALRNVAAREYVLSQNWQDVIADIPGAELLEQILNAKIDPDNPASVQAFLASLPREQEQFFSSQLYKKIPSNVAEMVPKWWKGLEMAGLKRKLQVAQTRMRSAEVNAGEILNLQKQIVDLREQIDRLEALLTARVDH